MDQNPFEASYEYAIQSDKQDELVRFQNEFYKKADTIYLDGNSLGLLSKRAEKSLLTMLNSWKEHGIDGWTEGEYPWFFLSEQLSEHIAPLIGALSEEIIVTGSTTTNIHQVIATFYEPKRDSYKDFSR
ncbi:hypothetical protein ACUIAK_13490 [Bacillus cytotoxicus]